MAFTEHLTRFAGLPVVNWGPETDPARLKDSAPRLSATSRAFRRSISLEERFEELLRLPQAVEIQALIMGYNIGESYAKTVAALVKHAQKLPALRALFLGEETYDENEVSWIIHGDCTELLNVYPGLEEFWVRGANQLALQPVRHIALRKLVFESGGLGADIPQAVHQCVFPELEHLEFYLGTEEYGWDGNLDTIRPFLYDNPFPKLKYLGLRNCEIVDEVAAIVGEAPILDQLDVLDLSLGNISDEGGRALIASPRLHALKKLDLHYHFMSDEIRDQLMALPMSVDVSDPQVAEEYDEDEVLRFISVTE